MNPRAIIEVNGIDVTGRLRAVSVTTTPWRAADTFSMTLVSDDELAEQLTAERQIETAIWLGYTKDSAKLPTKGELSKLHLGQADEDEWSMGRRGRLCRINGRDYTSLLLDRELRKNLGKRPSSTHVKALAEEAELDIAGVQTTSTPVLIIANGETAWEVIDDLALREGFVAYVRPGTKELYFGPAEEGDSKEPPVLAWRPTNDIAAIAEMTSVRSQASRRGVDIKVVSWDADNRRRIEFVLKNQQEGSLSLGERTFIVPGVTSRDEARKRAERLRAALDGGEKDITVQLQDGDVTLVGGGQVRLVGTGPWDGIWHIARAVHSLRLGAGLETTLTLNPPEMAREI